MTPYQIKVAWLYFQERLISAKARAAASCSAATPRLNFQGRHRALNFKLLPMRSSARCDHSIFRQRDLAALQQFLQTCLCIFTGHLQIEMVKDRRIQALDRRARRAETAIQINGAKER